MAKKTWIITRRAGYNFGSSLQALAMQRIVGKLGYPNEVIDYDELHHSLRWRLRPMAYITMYRTMRIFPALFRAVLPAKYEFLANYYRQRQKFDRFDKSTLKLTPKRYKTSAAIARDAADCDICICGSDQIWSPALMDPTMFMDFTSERTNTIAYAPSMAVDSIESEDTRRTIGALINRIRHVSIREEAGARVIKELTGRTVPVALDPTLLLDRAEWDGLQTKVDVPRPYILCYFLGHEDGPQAFIDNLKAATGLMTVNLPMSYNPTTVRADMQLRTASPDEFLWLTANAEYVCTNSFHATIFSILYHRDFFVFRRKHKPVVAGHSQNTRIDTLLGMFGLAGRLYGHSDEKCDMSRIDYHDIDGLMAENRKDSIAFLRSALDN